MKYELFGFVNDQKIRVYHLKPESDNVLEVITLSGTGIAYINRNFHEYISKSKEGDPIFVYYYYEMNHNLIEVLSFVKRIIGDRFMMISAEIQESNCIVMDIMSLKLGYFIYNAFYNNISNLFINSYIKSLIIMGTKELSDKLSRLKVSVTFDLLRLPDGDVLISCSDLDHDPVDNFVDNVSFCKSRYVINKEEMEVKLIMSEVDIEYHGIDVRKVDKCLKDTYSLKPYVSCMTINGEDVDPNEYIKFKSLELIWD